MKSISGKKLAQILEKKGWILVKTKGSHFKYKKESDSVSVPINGSIPNKITKDTFIKTDKGEDLIQCDNVEQMFNKLGI